MGRKKKVGTSGRFGARYGATLRKRLALIEAAEKKSYVCPNCGSVKVKRTSVGIWKCRKCNFTFAGGAYIPQTKIGEIAQRGKVLHAAEKTEEEE
jgi:large subunit ribosomal protein L37Ae